MGSGKESKGASKESGETQAELTEALRLAGRRRRPQSDGRFLISWNPGLRALCYGVLADAQPMVITSKRRIVKVDKGCITRPRFAPDIARRFVEDLQFGTPDVAQLLEWCRRTLETYFWLPDARLYWLITMWVFGTYCYLIFGYYGYLFLHSKLKRSGKTRVEEILSHLCFQASTVLNSPTAPSIRETAAEGGTVILDTLERWKGRSPEAYSCMMEFLDAGFRNGGVVMKMVSRGSNNWERVFIPVYAPYVLAAIDRDSLADTALDRSFVIEMLRKPITVRTKRYDFFRFEKEADELRQRLYILMLRNATAISKAYGSRALEQTLEALHLTDRAADIWRPLFAIARALGADSVEKVLASLAVEMGRDPESAEEERKLAIVSALKNSMNGAVSLAGMTSEFVSLLGSNGITATEIEVHDVLTFCGFIQHPARRPEGPRRVWELTADKLVDIERQLRSPKKHVESEVPQ
jgi:hypothetical protein